MAAVRGGARLTIGLAFVLALAVGCACGGPSGPDAGVDAGVDGGLVIAPPLPPMLTPCPAGWREVPPATAGGVATCDPFPEGGAQACAPDEAHFPGEPGCVRLGSPCPAGDFPENLPPNRPVLHVLPGATGGDGSEAAPFATLAEAMTAAAPGTIVALARGTYDEAVVMAAGVTLWGACVAETRIASSVPSEAAGTLTVTVAAVEVHNLQVGGARPGIWVAGAGASVHVEEVLILGAQKYGWITLDGASATGRSVAIRETAPLTGAGTLGRGLQAQGRAQLAVERAAIERNRDVGIIAFDAGTRVTLTDVVVRETLEQASDGVGGWGLGVQEGAEATVERVLFERNREVAIMAGLAGTRITLTDVVVRETLEQASSSRFGQGLQVQQGAEVTVARVLFERNREFGVLAASAGTRVTLTDVVVRETLEQASDGRFGRGLHVQEGAEVTVERGLFERNRDVGVIAFDTGTRVTLADVVVRETLERASDSAFGRGLTVQEGAKVTVERALFERNRDLGIFASRAGTHITLTDVVVRETLAQACVVDTCRDTGGGAGLVAVLDATIEATRFSVTQSALVGVQLARGGEIDLHLGEVAFNPIGANVQTPGFDTARLTDRVAFHDNGVNLDAQELPVPDPGAALP